MDLSVKSETFAIESTETFNNCVKLSGDKMFALESTKTIGDYSAGTIFYVSVNDIINILLNHNHTAYDLTPFLKEKEEEEKNEI